MACLILFILLTLHCVQSGYSEDDCAFCTGEEYRCINGYCYCATGYIPDYQDTSCIKCPGLGERCYGPCCSANSTETLQCWRGVCRTCYSPHGNWICRDSMEQVILISGSQIVMAVALVLGIIATFTLLYKLCAVTNLRSSVEGHSNASRLSVGSLQVYVNERLRDAPPRYSRSPAATAAATAPAAMFLNAGFIHDNSQPPPPYTPERKNDEEPVAVHI